MALDFNPFENDKSLKAPTAKKKLTKVKLWENQPSSPPSLSSPIDENQTSTQGSSLSEPANKLVLSMENISIANSAIENFATANTTIAKEPPDVDKFELKHELISSLEIAKENIEIKSSINNSFHNENEAAGSNSNLAIADSAIASSAIEKKAIDSSSIAEFAIEELSKLHKEKLSWEEKQKAAQLLIKKASQQAKETPTKLGFLQIDNFVFDVLFPIINNPSATIVYLLLYRRSWGFKNQPKVKISHQEIADKVGLSKRSVQDALDWLHGLELVESKRRFSTDIPEHFVKRPWIAKSAIANTAVADLAIADSATGYSKNCYSTMAKFATTEIQYENTNKNTLSLTNFLNSIQLAELEARWISFMKKEREREEKSLLKMFQQKPDEVETIFKAFQIVLYEQEEYGEIKSAISVLETNYSGQYRAKALTAITKQKQGANSSAIENSTQQKESDDAEAKILLIRMKTFQEAFPDPAIRKQYILEICQKNPMFSKFGVNSPIAVSYVVSQWAQGEGSTKMLAALDRETTLKKESKVK